MRSDRLSNANRKADRMPPIGETNSARQVIRVTTTMRGANNREIVRVRPFVRVAGNLSLSVSELTANLPRFNAQKMLAAADTAVADDAGAEPDAEVSFFTRDLTGVLPRAKIAAVVPIDEILTRVRDAANWDGHAGKHTVLADAMPVGSLAYASERHSDIYAGFEPRIVPENITLLPKTTTQTNGGNAWGERTILLKKGDSVSANLRDLGATTTTSRRSPPPSGRAAGTRRRATATSCGCCWRRRTAASGCSRSASSSPPTARSKRSSPGRTRASMSPSTRAAPTPSRLPPTMTTRTTARACGSTKASTRPRCATRCRGR